MPHRRRPQKGSFGSHFDELVKHFPENGDETDQPRSDDPNPDGRSVHDRLFETAWSHKDRKPPR